jgi:hypothetical protein
MKLLFLLWIAIRSTFEAAVWATAVWCLLYSFTNILWPQCFWVFIPVHLLWNMSFVEYVSTHTKQDCLFYMRRELMLVGLAVLLAPIISILPAVAAIVLLSLLQVWTNLETHWLHTWLFVACIVYMLSRGSGKRSKVIPGLTILGPTIRGPTRRRSSGHDRVVIDLPWDQCHPIESNTQESVEAQLQVKQQDCPKD